MTASTLTFRPRRLPYASRWLICMDLQREYVVPGRPRYAPGNSEVVASCARVVAMAREDGWRIVHSQLHPAEGMFGAPIEGLRPLISEPVFFRRGLSAFANPAFASELRCARGEEVYLIGFSLADTCIATALAGIDEGLSLTLVEDALGAGPALEAADAARTILQPLVQLVSSRSLEHRRLEVLS
ncbi:MAG TPA: isochorismatase family protein [Caulobacteraceae bacterium]|nr:isochorismatase family protein [Caulobacteraceae bacterium]